MNRGRFGRRPSPLRLAADDTARTCDRYRTSPERPRAPRCRRSGHACQPRCTRTGYGVPALTADIDVAIGGEASEAGGNAEYALDAAAIGKPKGMIILGHLMSEDHGMQEVAEWLRTLVSDVPIEFIRAGEPFSRID